MPTLTARWSLPLSIVAALALLLALAIPVAAGPVGVTTAGDVLADHVDPEDCVDITVDGGGNLVIDGVTLTAGQVALLDAETIVALHLAAAAAASADGDGDACVAVTIEPQVITVDADIIVCGEVALDGEGGATVAGVAIAPELLTTDIAAILEAAAAAGVEACVLVTVADNEVLVEAWAEACVIATLNTDGSLTLSLDSGDLLLFANAIVDAEGVLEIGATTEVGLLLYAWADLATMTSELIIEVIELEGCGEPDPGPTPTPTPTPAATPTPISVLPDASTPANGGGLNQMAMVLVLLFSLAGFIVIRRRDSRVG